MAAGKTQTAAAHPEADVYAVRMPIFDRRLKVAGYELMFRQQPALGADELTSSATASGLRKLTEDELTRLVGAGGAWVRVEPRDLAPDLEDVLAQRIVVEISSRDPVDDDGLATLEALRRRGVTVALRDFSHSTASERLLRAADFVKLDVAALGRERLRDELALLERHAVVVVGDRVESQSDHDFCVDAGFDLVQGRFFCRPSDRVSAPVDPSTAAAIQFLAALHDPNVEIEELQLRISMDIALTLRLLRHINSAYFGLGQSVRSIRQALVLLGLKQLKRWATVAVFASAERKPAELTVTALARGRFCELAAEHVAAAAPEELFTVGLLSVLDALLDLPMAQALAGIPLAPDIRDALIARSGPGGRLVECVVALELGEFSAAEGILGAAGAIYTEAIEWADAAVAPLRALACEATTAQPLEVMGTGGFEPPTSRVEKQSAHR